MEINKESADHLRKAAAIMDWWANTLEEDFGKDNDIKRQCSGYRIVAGLQRDLAELFENDLKESEAERIVATENDNEFSDESNVYQFQARNK